jgi:hypothetical protein
VEQDHLIVVLEHKETHLYFQQLHQQVGVVEELVVLQVQEDQEVEVLIVVLEDQEILRQLVHRKEIMVQQQLLLVEEVVVEVELLQ